MGIFGPDIYGFGLGTEEEEFQDPLGALSQAQADRQAQTDRERKEREDEQARQRALAELSRMRSGSGVSSLPQSNPTPSGGVHDSNPYGASDQMLDEYRARIGASPGRGSFLGDTSEDRIGRREHPILNFSMGKGPMMAYDPLKENGGVPDVGATGRGGFVSGGGGSLSAQSQPEEWESRVANPAAFSAYRESVMRPQIEAERSMDRALTTDPFAKERAIGGIQTKTALDIETGKEAIQGRGEEELKRQYMAELEKEQKDFAQALSVLDKQTLDPKAKQARAQAWADQHQERMQSIKEAYVLSQKAKVSQGFYGGRGI